MREPAYMRNHMLADDDPRRTELSYWIEPASIEEVLDGIDRCIAKGYHLDSRHVPFLHHDESGGVRLFGNFQDLSAAFCVTIPLGRVEEVRARIIAALRACEMEHLVRRCQ